MMGGNFIQVHISYFKFISESQRKLVFKVMGQHPTPPPHPHLPFSVQMLSEIFNELCRKHARLWKRLNNYDENIKVSLHCHIPVRNQAENTL